MGKVSATILLVANLAGATTLAHAEHRSYVRHDCGLQMHHAWIARTRGLITHKAPFVAPISEAATRTGHFECIRFTFGIDAQGRASDIKIANTTGSFLMAMEARKTLKRYRFQVPANHSEQRYSLVFSGVIDKLPPPPKGEFGVKDKY